MKSEASESRYEFQADLALSSCTRHQQEALARQISRRAADLTGQLHCLRDGTCTLDTPLVTGCQLADPFVDDGASGGGRRRRDTEGEEGRVHISVAITYHSNKGNYWFIY